MNDSHATSITATPPVPHTDEVLHTTLARHGQQPQALVQVLRDLQEGLGWLPRPVLIDVAAALGVPLGEVEGVAGFYRFLHQQPVGRYRVLFSDNVIERQQGSRELMASLCHRLRVQPGAVRDDGCVSVAPSSCIGLSDQGPSVLLNHRQVVTQLDEERIAQMAVLIDDEVPLDAWPADWSRVHDVVQRADVLLGPAAAPGDALQAALARGADGLLAELQTARLRGRGGAGYPTAAKWQACRDAAGSEKIVVCNADEGEPGTFKDRALLRHQAGALIEGMTMAAFVLGARRGFIYLRGEYRWLRDELAASLQAHRAAGLLGLRILGREGFDFDIAVHLGAGAYVCGEESALIESLEGKRGTPRIRPPFPAEHGYRGHPTVVNNVETYCAVSHIARHGGAWWAGIGTRQSTGTKIHSVSGDCERPGLYEYPFGTRVGRLLEDCGARNTQAVQVGGPSGVCLSAFEFGRRLAFEDVPTAGAFMVFDRSRDLFEVARGFAAFFAHESCGFCTPCRVGTELLLRRMDKLAAGAGSRHDIDVLFELDHLLHATTHCGLGATACNPLRDTIQKFRPAYEQRLQSLHFAPGFDLDAELSVARRLTGRDDAAAHFGTPNPT
jgi:[NiFe] hydrogenase diaphorase moiety large subunit